MVRRASPAARGCTDILIVLIDDAGPGLPTTFGGEVTTRTMERIVQLDSPTVFI